MTTGLHFVSRNDGMGYQVDKQSGVGYKRLPMHSRALRSDSLMIQLVVGGSRKEMQIS
jgi:hypothetical protein